MDTNRRIIAAAELVLIFPAALFMTAVVTRHLQPLQYELAHTAQQIVIWYSVRRWTLWVLLIGLPFAALVSGCGTLLRNWHRAPDSQEPARQSSAAIPTDLATRIIAAATLLAGAVLVVVAAHMLAN
jgi:hypothetical protein